MIIDHGGKFINKRYNFTNYRIFANSFRLDKSFIRIGNNFFSEFSKVIFLKKKCSLHVTFKVNFRHKFSFNFLRNCRGCISIMFLWMLENCVWCISIHASPNVNNVYILDRRNFIFFILNLAIYFSIFSHFWNNHKYPYRLIY